MSSECQDQLFSIHRPFWVDTYFVCVCLCVRAKDWERQSNSASSSQLLISSECKATQTLWSMHLCRHTCRGSILEICLEGCQEQEKQPLLLSSLVSGTHTHTLYIHSNLYVYQYSKTDPTVSFFFQKTVLFFKFFYFKKAFPQAPNITKRENCADSVCDA